MFDRGCGKNAVWSPARQPLARLRWTCPRSPRIAERHRFAADSALEGSGFELLVPLRKRHTVEDEFRPKTRAGCPAKRVQRNESGPRKAWPERTRRLALCSERSIPILLELIALVAVSRRTSRCSPAAGEKQKSRLRSRSCRHRLTQCDPLHGARRFGSTDLGQRL